LAESKKRVKGQDAKDKDFQATTCGRMWRNGYGCAEKAGLAICQWLFI